MSFFIIRPHKPEDINFIMATFLRGLYYGQGDIKKYDRARFNNNVPQIVPSWYRLMSKDLFMKYYSKVAEILLHKSAIMIACLPDDENVILGYSILSTDFDTIHFVFVKSPWRNQGIGRALTPQLATSVTHLTDLGRELLPKLENAIFNPFAV